MIGRYIKTTFTSVNLLHKRVIMIYEWTNPWCICLVLSLIQIFKGVGSAVPCPRIVRRSRQIELTDDQLMELMKLKGVPYVPDYMAPSLEQAKRQFPDMIHLTESYQKGHSQAHAHQFSGEVDNQRTIKRLLEDMKHGYSEHVHHGNPRTDQTEFVDKLQNLTSALLRFNFTLASSLLNRLLPGSQENLSLLLKRRKRETNTDASITQIDYCKARGTLTPDGSYMRMCSTCAATTTLPAHHFPRVINEVICSNTDRTCFTVNGVAHGRCTQRVFHLNMLRRKNDSCEMVNVDLLEDHLLSNQWEVYTQPIRVSCECEIDKLSMFASYITASTSQSSP